MINTLNKCVIALAVLMIIMTAPTAPGISSIRPDDNPGGGKILPSTTEKQSSLMLSEYKENTAGEKSQTTSSTKDPESETRTDSETDNKEPSTKSKSDPLRSFKPSEEIAAEQAVDFPVDI